MTAYGALEVRLGRKVYKWMSSSNGFLFFDIIGKFTEYLKGQGRDPEDWSLADSVRHKTNAEYIEWFIMTGGKIADSIRSGRIVPCEPAEVVFDLERKIILHTGSVEDEHFVTALSPESLVVLKRRNYQLISFKYRDARA